MDDVQPQFDSIAIVGVGLIGGSIALAARQNNLCRHVIGVGRTPERLEDARQRGIIDLGLTDINALEDVGLVIICTPVNHIVTDALSVLKATPPSTLVTDAGSVKARICRELDSVIPEARPRFVGSHPLAGSHQSGFENACVDLYVGRKCVVTPQAESPDEVIRSIVGFWRGIGIDVRTMSPEHHDRILALTSHLPHLAASAVAGLVEEEALDFAATGFRDTTRVAAGDADLWTAIFMENADEVIAATDLLIAKLEEYRNSLALGHTEQIRQELDEARRRRLQFQSRHE